MQQTSDNKLTLEEINKIEQNYIKSNSVLFINAIMAIIENSSKDKTYLVSKINGDFDELYDNAKSINPAALPYAKMTTLVFDSTDDSFYDELLPKLENFYKNKFESLKQTDSLNHTDGIAISAIAKTFEHLSLAINQKRSLYNEQIEKLNELDSKSDSINSKLIDYQDDQSKKLTDQKEEFNTILIKYKRDIDLYKEKYDKMTIDFLSMMGIFSTIIFAVFGGLSQIGAIGDNLSETPIHKILMYISLSSITLIFIVFISFNAISKLTGMKLRSCDCDSFTCTHSVIEKHPTLSFSLFFFIDILLFSLVLRVFNSSNWVHNFRRILFTKNLESWILIIATALFIIFNITVLCKIYKFWFKKK